MYTKFLSGSLKEGDHSKNAGVDGRIILKGIVKKRGEKLRIGTRGDSCEDGNKSCLWRQSVSQSVSYLVIQASA